jgi:Ca2+/Na+ antiporter
MERPSLSFFAMLFILLFAVIGFIFAVFDLRSIFFVFQLAILLSFMFFLAFGMFLALSRKKSSWGIISAVLVLMIFDTFVIMMYTKRFSVSYAITSIFALAGLAVALVKVMNDRRNAKEPETPDHYKKSQYYYSQSGNKNEQPIMEPKEETKHEIKSEQKISAAYTPGKYIASKKANKFHSPKCDWASRISKENQVWFVSREEAQSKGFKADKCV